MRSFIIETINPKNAKKILNDLLGLNEVLFKMKFYKKEFLNNN
ncbi:hypothetical protein [Helicobacter pylori]|nr:hypothetical protein [Helicobacter pylori]